MIQVWPNSSATSSPSVHLPKFIWDGKMETILMTAWRQGFQVNFWFSTAKYVERYVGFSSFFAHVGLALNTLNSTCSANWFLFLRLLKDLWNEAFWVLQWRKSCATNVSTYMPHPRYYEDRREIAKGGERWFRCSWAGTKYRRQEIAMTGNIFSPTTDRSRFQKLLNRNYPQSKQLNNWIIKVKLINGKTWCSSIPPLCSSGGKLVIESTIDVRESADVPPNQPKKLIAVDRRRLLKLSNIFASLFQSRCPQLSIVIRFQYVHPI